ncbi:MAG: monovalent cation/H(+) antiporter subunit G [Rhodobacteraceae bacterium]|nr:monovalent cation/H(+) antiporter subunit G [Paracoccaceae bacterium]
METVVTAIVWVLLLAGSFFTVAGAVGIVRFPDFWARLHAASVTDSAGVILLLAGMCVYAGWGLVTVKLIAIGLLLFITGPTATHAVANAALVSGLRPTEAKGLKGAEPEPLVPSDDDHPNPI